MQSGYGGVSEMQQFMVDGGCPSSLFSISTAPPNAANQSAAAAAEIHRSSQKFNPYPHPHHNPHQHPPPHLQHQHPPPPPHIAYFGHPIPITQQLFQHTQQQQQQHHHHQFQLFHHQQHLRLDPESGPETSNSPSGGGPSFLAAMNFKLGVNESSGGGSRDGLNEDDGILQGDEGSESRLHHSWHREEESAAANIKEPFWRPLDIDYINPNNKRPAKDKQPEEISSNAKHFKKSNEASLNHNQANSNNNVNTATADSSYKLFSELEAIYKPGGTPTSCGGGGAAGTNNQTGSGASALTGDDNPLMSAAAPRPAAEYHQPDNVSDTSNGGGGGVEPPPVAPSKFQKGKSKRSKRARQQKQLASIATFFESLVKQLTDHQDALHRNFLEVMERRDQERTNREEAWRKQEAAKANREATARAQERAVAASQDAAILSFLEKITGESLNLPTKIQFTNESQKEPDGNLEVQNMSNYNNNNAMEPYNADSANNNAGGGGGGGIQLFSSSRWPKAEVEELIRVRSGLESRFQGPGLKGPLWEEVSMAMAGMGYNRSSKRCKEKWENINKYFRKTKDSGKKRPQQSKTCPYFHQLNQLLYSKSLNAITTTNTVTPSSTKAADEGKENSELLDTIVVSNAELNEAADNECEDEEEGGGDRGEEGQGESQEIQGEDSDINIKRGLHHHQLQLGEVEKNAQRDSAHFFPRLRT